MYGRDQSEGQVVCVSTARRSVLPLVLAGIIGLALIIGARILLGGGGSSGDDDPISLR